MSWLVDHADGATPLDRALGLRPDLATLFHEYADLLWSEDLVDPVVLELCRLRIAQVHGDPDQLRLRHEPAVAAGLTEDLVAALPRSYDSPLFTEHQRACIAYAEQFVVDVHGITDENARRVQQSMNDAEFVAFTVALGLLDGVGRMRLVLGLTVSDDTSGPLVVGAPMPEGPHH